MIPVNCGDTIFDEMVQASIIYDKYTNKIEFNNSSSKQVFVDDVNGIPILSVNDRSAIQKSESNIIILDMITEGYDVFLNHIHNKLPTNKKYIVFANGWWNQDEVITEINYTLIHWNYFIYNHMFRLNFSNSMDYFQDINYNFSNEKEFIFVALIGTARDWRTALVDHILTHIQFDNYILNYHGDELKQSSRGLDIKYDFSNYNSYTPIDQYYSISSSIPIRIYNKAKVLLVVESTFMDFNEFHLTEKTVKALITGIPFVVVGSYKFLEHLHNLGFKTYNDIWSEEYDNIKEPTDKITAIVSLLNQISNLEWDDELVAKLKQIAYHNKTQLLNAQTIMKKQLDTIAETFANYEI